jgi:biopolymer transport protein ExbD
MSVHRGLKWICRRRAHLLKGERLVITVSADNALALNKSLWRSTSWCLPRSRAGVRTPSRWLISADRAAALGTGIELLGKLKNGGVEQVAFQVSGEAPTPR